MKFRWKNNEHIMVKQMSLIDYQFVPHIPQQVFSHVPLGMHFNYGISDKFATVVYGYTCRLFERSRTVFCNDVKKLRNG